MISHSTDAEKIVSRCLQSTRNWNFEHRRYSLRCQSFGCQYYTGFSNQAAFKSYFQQNLSQRWKTRANSTRLLNWIKVQVAYTWLGREYLYIINAVCKFILKCVKPLRYVKKSSFRLWPLKLRKLKTKIKTGWYIFFQRFWMKST